MLKALSDAIEKVARGKTITIVIVVYLVFHVIVMPWFAARINAHSGGVGLLDLQIRTTPQKTYEMLSFYGEAGRSLYLRTELTVDIVFAILNAVFFSFLITYSYRRAFSPASPVQRLNLFPFLILAADLLENTGIVMMLLHYPEKLLTVARVTGVLTMIKWSTIVLSLIAIVTGLIALLRKEALTRPD